ncbi:MAG: acetyl-CoA carboxylase biotin carboxyl carrier protein subunit [Bacteroidales bacterium]|jgi:biotin carboxyl carrier protein|nr:acetyl-CoA carboxylase biotin carboxyl carrier protein subunit [Bacteroidales bacterium]MDD2426248.1 acetyl-CoA carboxylase biotin carboxyl carrier protein subunit [Bacteroidales bacterium]MDD3989466.1 acetyl-CoA carboxylase biotin carboxyl carrier protein subunit [Bacteroidales bacterium]MDD4638494.1 acetyl-CoA carboxylase biotin carboxyl carrier protein subunit [Bacteroidales bacterium]
MKNTDNLDTLQITQQGRKYKTTLTNKYKNRKIWKNPDPREIYSVIPCTVSALYTSEGAKIEKGDKILEFEAMKMKNILIAPFSGKVEKIFVKQGDKIAKGFLMLILQMKEGETDRDATSISPDPIG